MPNIPGLPAASSVANADLLVIDDGVTTQQATRSQVLTAAAGEDIALINGTVQVLLSTAGELVLEGGGGGIVQLHALGYVNIGAGAGQVVIVGGSSTVEVVITVLGSQAFNGGVDSDGTPSLRIPARMDLGFAFPATTLGSVVGGFPIYDISGTLIGYVPVYDSIT